ncbi:unnamed protein product [Cuscuta epithymum]|uniref:Thioredoxin domain-containing protein n=1 Tax=Cuscuta epithymum TaxID=186058 RepID=A0AAV0FJM0_9ASTE|nr:unnamed protein product [Cuscuta epithymum]
MKSCMLLVDRQWKENTGNLISATNDDKLRDLFDQIRTSKTPVVINYGASWCHVCRQILPAFCELSNSFPKYRLYMLILMIVQRQPSMSATRKLSISTVMGRGLMRCLMPAKRDCMTGSGCTLRYMGLVLFGCTSLLDGKSLDF